ncbi:MAG TPA: acyloxyacyl hydrolase [Bacteroidia bacterium]|nr:acyloxyacyl hydrolase [Bacteroidia bacterium]
MRKKIFWFLLSFAPFFSFSQRFLNPDYAEGNFNSGYIIKNHPQFPDVSQPSFSGGIHLAYKLNGTKPWHKNYNYAELGFHFIYGSIGNKKVLGNFAGFVPEMIFPHRISNRLKISESLGIGVSYFNAPYNQVSNPENIVIGSHITFFAMAAVSIEYKLNKNFSVMLRPSIYHSSNAHTALPNVGMNIPSVGIGVKCMLHEMPSIMPADSVFTYDKKIHFNMRLGLGINEQGGSTGPPKGPKYPVYIASFFITKNFSTVNKVQLGIEGWYNTGVHDYITSQDYYDDQEKIKSAAVVFFLGHEFLVGHFSLVAQGGIYLYNPFYRDKLKSDNVTSFKQKLKTVFPARLGYHYYLFDSTIKHRHNLFVAIYVKTNLGQADFLDTGIGYTF